RARRRRRLWLARARADQAAPVDLRGGARRTRRRDRRGRDGRRLLPRRHRRRSRARHACDPRRPRRPAPRRERPHRDASRVARGARLVGLTDRSIATDAAATDAGADKRRQILGAAVRVFARSGYHGARVGDIAEEAGVAHGLLYHYFSSKEEVLATIFRENWR